MFVMNDMGTTASRLQQVKVGAHLRVFERFGASGAAKPAHLDCSVRGKTVSRTTRESSSPRDVKRPNEFTGPMVLTHSEATPIALVTIASEHGNPPVCRARTGASIRPTVGIASK